MNFIFNVDKREAIIQGRAAFGIVKAFIDLQQIPEEDRQIIAEWDYDATADAMVIPVPTSEFLDQRDELAAHYVRRTEVNLQLVLDVVADMRRLETSFIEMRREHADQVMGAIRDDLIPSIERIAQRIREGCTLANFESFQATCPLSLVELVEPLRSDKVPQWLANECMKPSGERMDRSEIEMVVGEILQQQRLTLRSRSPHFTTASSLIKSRLSNEPLVKGSPLHFPGAAHFNHLMTVNLDESLREALVSTVTLDANRVDPLYWGSPRYKLQLMNDLDLAKLREATKLLHDCLAEAITRMHADELALVRKSVALVNSRGGATQAACDRPARRQALRDIDVGGARGYVGNYDSGDLAEHIVTALIEDFFFKELPGVVYRGSIPLELIQEPDLDSLPNDAAAAYRRLQNATQALPVTLRFCGSPGLPGQFFARVARSLGKEVFSRDFALKAA